MKAHQWLAWKNIGRVPNEHHLKEVFSERNDEEVHDSCDDDFLALPLTPRTK